MLNSCEKIEFINNNAARPYLEKLSALLLSDATGIYQRKLQEKLLWSPIENVGTWK